MKPVEEKRILLALYEAAGHPDGEEDVRRFIAAGASVKSMKYILHRAVRYGSTEIVRLLLEHGARVDTRGSFDCTPLHDAAYFMRHECIPLLLAAGADVNAISDSGRTPLEYAASPISSFFLKREITAAERFCCMKQLMKAGAILRETHKSIAELFCKAVEENELSIVDELLEMGVPPDTCSHLDKRPIYTAVVFEQYACMERLFAAGADIHRIVKRETLMHVGIIRKCTIKLVEWLLAHGFNPDAKDADGTPCLHEAARRGRPDIMQRLIAAGADAHSVAADGSTLLHAAVEGKQSDALQFALSLGLNVNAKNKSGRTPLHLAAADDLEEIVRLLLNAGANVNAKAKKGATPLACVDRVGYTTVSQLVEAGAETSSDAVQNVLCRTFIVSAKNADELAMLLELIDLTRRDCSGNTPLHRWLADCQPEPQSMRYFFPKLQRLFYEHTMAAFLFLAEQGVNFNLINNDGQSVLDLATKHANAHVNRALREAGAKYGYELGSAGERKLMESILSPIRPIDLPEPEEWHSVDDVLAYARQCTTLCGLTDWQWTVEKMDSDCLGCCCHHTKTMKLTAKLLGKGQLEIRNVIIQALAHALAGPGHERDLVWRLWCSALGLEVARLQNVPADEEKKTKLAGIPTQEETPQIVSVEPPRTTHVLCHRETGEVFRRFTKLPRYTAEALAKMTIRGREDETRGQLCVVEMPKDGDRYTGFVVLDKKLCLCSDCFYRDLDSNEIIEARLYKGLRRVHYLFLPHRIVAFAPAANKRRPAQTSTPEPIATRA